MRIAICDDENMQLSMTKTSLETAYKSLDLIVDTYTSGAKLLDAVDSVHYDLIIFGDVLEHMTVEDAQAVVDYARDRCDNMLIAVPFLYEQGAKNGNPYEIHLQADLTPELFNERFPGFKPIYMSEDYAYYVKAD